MHMRKYLSVSSAWHPSFPCKTNFANKSTKIIELSPKMRQYIFSLLLHHVLCFSCFFSSRLASVFPCYLTAEQSLTKQQGCYGNITLPLMTSRLRLNKYGCQMGCRSVYLQIFIKVIQTEVKRLLVWNILIFINAHPSKHSISLSLWCVILFAFCEVNPHFLHHE